MSTVIRKWLKCVLVFSFVCGVVIPLSLFIVTNGYDDLDGNRSPFMIRMQGFEGKLYSHERKPLDYPEAQASNHEEVRYQMQELQRIVVSVRNELRQLEQERNQVRKDVDKSKSTLSKLRKEVGAAKSSLQDSKAKLAKTLREMKRANHYEGETQMNKSPVVVVNLPRDQDVPIPRKEERNLLKGEKSVSSDCFDAVCFEYSRCPLTNPFSVYVYNQHQPDHFDLKHPDIVEDLLSSLRLKHSLTTDPNLACIFIVIIGPLRTSNEDPPLLQQKLESLPHWNGGRNHVIVDLSDSLDGAVAVHGPLAASIGARSYTSNDDRKGYNILLPPVTSFRTDEPPLGKLPLFLPGFRQFLFLFEGVLDEGETRSVPTGRTHISGRQLALVKEAINSNTKDKVVINTECNGAKELGEKFDSQDHHAEHFGEWLLCGVAHDRALSLSQATFSLVLGSTSGTLGPVSYTRLVEGLHYGAIPVVLGVRHLPFDSVIDWKRAAVMLPVTSLGQLHYILKNLPTDSILKYRRQGRFLWETYFSSPVAIMDTVVAILRQRAHHPPPAATSYVAETNLASIPGDNFILPSREFLYNFTYSSDELWNSPPGPFYMYPTTPFKPAPVSGSQYVNLDVKHISNLPQHVVAAGGITGPFFEDYLLGNYPEEQFTVVMLTYERNEVLVEALKRLRDLDHLAKVVVVWNGLEPPPVGMSWPELGVPLEVLSVGRNSLNNRFLPFSNVNTEAVLSIDDDVHLRHDEIQFAFRVWREARDRIVGFPGRFHAWDTRHEGWLYNSNYTCELSMVLTGAAFLHKYYMFLYSHWLYRGARDLVDKYINCEDIAMNFLVSHITRKPPLKVTSRWTFRCPGCPESLSSNNEHFSERHVCMNELVSMFGYMPLLYTQFRLDSVLFKTRLPSHLEKCYEFI